MFGTFFRFSKTLRESARSAGLRDDELRRSRLYVRCTMFGIMFLSRSHRHPDPPWSNTDERVAVSHFPNPFDTTVMVGFDHGHTSGGEEEDGGEEATGRTTPWSFVFISAFRIGSHLGL